MISLTKFNIKSFKDYRIIFGNILVGFSFLLLTLITVKTFAPEVNSEAANQTASETIGPYTMSMSNDSVTTINAVPTPSQRIYSSSNDLRVTNTCTAGATITMAMNSTSNSLIRPSSGPDDEGIKEITATTSTSLDNNSWGYALTDTSTYYAVPKKNSTPATIYSSSAAQISALTIPLSFGVKIDYLIPSGSYSNDIVYTMTPKTGCYSYSLTWDMNGGTAKSGATYPTSLNWGQTVNLSTLTPTRPGYTFAGWTNGSSTFTGSETVADLNSANATSVTVTAKWQAICAGTYGSQRNVNLAVNGTENFDYTGNAVCATIQKEGYYKLEVWGGKGGDAITSGKAAYGGYGGYSYGTISLSSGQALYIYVGGQGTSANTSASTSDKVTATGGWNGGGLGYTYSWSGDWTAGGGGATDISINNGTSWNSAQHLYSRILVAGGGGGGSTCGTSNYGHGGNGGGYDGGNGNASNDSHFGKGASQTSGGANGNLAVGANSATFGKGAEETLFANNTTARATPGGGGGWYGGGAGGHYSGAGGGSGYIYNSSSESSYPSGKLVNSAYYLSNAGMYMYNGNAGGCSSSTATATKTTCTSSSSSTATSNYTKQGNGYARITYLGTSI